MRKVVFRDWKFEFCLNQHASNNAGGLGGEGRLGMYHWDSGTFSLYQTTDQIQPRSPPRVLSYPSQRIKTEGRRENLGTRLQHTYL